MMDGTSDIMRENEDERVLEMPRERHSPNMFALLLLALATLAAACASSGGASSSVGADQNLAVEVASGLDAISEAQGTPHILWFWGAN